MLVFLKGNGIFESDNDGILCIIFILCRSLKLNN